MKTTIEIDCTPSEARELLGLPDVREIQSRVMKDLQERMTLKLDSTSPDALLREWFTFDPQWLKPFFGRVFKDGFGAPENKERG
ncbi:MAG: DUF6489 family protein [Beijerinckiaceae bacterium]